MPCLLPRIAAAGALLGAALALPAAAQDEAPAGYPGPMLHGKLELGLAEAIGMGLENNLDVQVARYDPILAQQDALGSWGAFDPTLFADAGYLDRNEPNANVIFGTTLNIDTGWDGEGGFRGILPLLGTEYNVSMLGSSRQTNSRISALSPEYRSSLSLGITQPLLKDLIWSQPWTQVKTTELVYRASQEGFRTTIMDTVQNIEAAYWNLIAAEERVRVAKKSLETARALLDQTKTQFEVGVVSKVAVVQAEAGVAQRDFDLIVATNQYRNQQDVLIDLVLGPHLRASSTLELRPTDRPGEYIQYDIDVETAVRQAFENRPELAQLHQEIERQTVQLKFAKNQRLPSLDAVFSYGPNGLAGSTNNLFGCGFGGPDPECENAVANNALVPPTNFGNSMDDWWTDRGARTWTARGRFSIPIPNTGARKQVSRSEFELRRAESRLRRLEQSIILEVRKAARDLKAAQEGIESAERAQLSAAEQLRAEQIRLEYGEATPFDVLLREEQLVESERGLIGAYQTYRVSATGLDRAQGTILRNRNIKIDQVSALR
jgi:outer membrane protein TolC